MQEYLQKTQFSRIMDEIGVAAALLIGSLGLFFLLWGLRPMAILAGISAFTLCMLLRTRTREARLRRREEALRRRIGGELKLESWLLCPARQAHFETALLLGRPCSLSPLRLTEAGVLCAQEGCGDLVLVACARLHHMEKLTAREIAAFQRACLASGASHGYLCGAAGAVPEAREQAQLAPPITLVDRQRMIALAGMAEPATDSQLVALGQRYRGNHSLRTLRLAALSPERAEKYLLYGMLLLGLHLLSGQAMYLITGLICLALMTLCRVLKR